ncbi:hypothetical protein SAMN04487948_11743 [Halogranum amylolyticum]|uniref:Uncharacterized protein n=1 Tax=Halogranum amylolyticum TaxID=660520 RepID=A0A1H8VJP8_9EURY|nr:hypothetical protein SAMN04487948_11743 [Halogranum amylolyticum]
MCNRHVPHMIADYEAARLEADEEGPKNRTPETRNRRRGISPDYWRLSGADSLDNSRFRSFPLTVPKVSS